MFNISVPPFQVTQTSHEHANIAVILSFIPNMICEITRTINQYNIIIGESERSICTLLCAFHWRRRDQFVLIQYTISMNSVRIKGGSSYTFSQ